jgi:hypothetical protein
MPQGRGKDSPLVKNLNRDIAEIRSQIDLVSESGTSQSGPRLKKLRARLQERQALLRSAKLARR